MLTYGGKFLIECPHRAKIDSHKHCVNGYVIILVYQMILHDHVIKGSFDFMGRSPSRQVNLTAKFGDHRHCGSGDIAILVCHVISQNHVMKG